jgi:hypothetical protein
MCPQTRRSLATPEQDAIRLRYQTIGIAISCSLAFVASTLVQGVAIAGPQDRELAAALENCDRQAAQQTEAELKQKPIEPTTMLNPVLLMLELDARKRYEEDQPRRLALVEQQHQQCRQAAEATAVRRVNEARNQDRDRERGYRPISIETFVLDGKDMAAHSAKVSLRGAYMQEGNTALLFADQVAVLKATRYPEIGRNEPRVLLFTDKASREARQYFLRCNSNPALAQVGCPVIVLGRITTCQLTGPTGMTRTLPCIAVEEGRPAAN